MYTYASFWSLKKIQIEKIAVDQTRAVIGDEIINFVSQEV